MRVGVILTLFIPLFQLASFEPLNVSESINPVCQFPVFFQYHGDWTNFILHPVFAVTSIQTGLLLSSPGF